MVDALPHPYYPLGVEIPGYLANTMTTPEIFAYFTMTLAAVMAPVFLVARRVKLSGWETFLVLWFTISGCIHLFLEGYYAINHRSIMESPATLSQLWKEYSRADSRYLTVDPFLIIMESITAFLWGPICLILVPFIMFDHPLRLPLAIIVSLGQIYGDILYYGIVLIMDAYYGVVYSRPEAVYFWAYFVGMNAVWMFIPGYILYYAVCEVRDKYTMVQAALRRRTEVQKVA